MNQLGAALTFGKRTTLFDAPQEAWMATTMGSFRTDVSLENLMAAAERRLLRGVLVHTGAVLSWFPKDVLQLLQVRPQKEWRFRRGDGTTISRWTAEVRVFVGGTSTIDEVVIGEPGDPTLLGARSLEGLNLCLDPIAMRLVDAGPAPAAATI